MPAGSLGRYVPSHSSNQFLIPRPEFTPWKKQVDEKLKELESQHKLVVKFSVTGYSLGGRECLLFTLVFWRVLFFSWWWFLVVARYLIGLLHSRSPSFFDTHKPISFSTLSSPVSPGRDPIVHRYFYNTGADTRILSLRYFTALRYPTLQWVT